MFGEPEPLLAELMERLPELEWKINGLGPFFSGRRLPRGLFRCHFEPSSQACIAELKEDIDALSRQTNSRSAFYQAERIRQKINVLVALCQMNRHQHKPEEHLAFGVKMLGTRQQWIGDLEQDIRALTEQQQAMNKTLIQMMRTNNATAILHLKAELGQLEQRLTLARETLQRAIS